MKINSIYNNFVNYSDFSGMDNLLRADLGPPAGKKLTCFIHIML